MTYPRWFHVILFMLAVGFGHCLKAQETSSEYRLGPGDSIRITVFHNPDLTLETRVSENGAINFPLIGAVTIGGMTIAAAEATIARALRAGNFLQKPQVNINLLQYRGSQVSVLGQVSRPGRYPLETLNTRLSEMLATAGGVTPVGADVVTVTGTREGKPFRREIDIRNLSQGSQMQDDIILIGGDVVYVDRAPMFYIHGEVQRPGSYRVERGMTVRQALAQGGGLSVRGTERGLRLYRRGADGVVETLSPEMNDLIRADDVLQVRESLF